MSDGGQSALRGHQALRRPGGDLKQYARVAVWRVWPGTLARVIQRAEASLLPLLQRQPGYVAHALQRTGEDEATAISTWATPEAAARSLQLTGRWVEDHVAELVAAVATREEAVIVDYGPFHEGAHDAAGSWHE